MKKVSRNIRPFCFYAYAINAKMSVNFTKTGYLRVIAK